MRVQWYRVKGTYEQPQGGSLRSGCAIRACSQTTVSPFCSRTRGDAQWTEVVDVEYLEESPDEPPPAATVEMSLTPLCYRGRARTRRDKELMNEVRVSAE